MDVRLNLIDVFRQLDKETRQFWVDLINRYLLNSKYVTVSLKLLQQVVLDMIVMLAIARLLLPARDSGTVYLSTSSLPRHSQHFVTN